MSRSPLSRAEYEQVAIDHDLVFVGTEVPGTIAIPTRFQCGKCGRVMTKSLKAVRHGKNPCTCQNGVTLVAADYHKLAKALGITWLGPINGDYSVPQNTKVKTRWQGTLRMNDHKPRPVVEATYHQLAYSTLTRIMARRLGLPEPAPTGVVGNQIVSSR